MIKSEYNQAINDARRQVALLGIKNATALANARASNLDGASIRLSARIRVLKEVLVLLETLKKP